MSAGPGSAPGGGESGALDGDASTAEKARRLAAVEPLVRGMCAKRLGARGADDAAQAVLEQVWRAQHRQVFDSEEAVRRYAAAVARVMPANDDRRSAHATSVGELGELLWADEGPGPEEVAERAEAVAEARERVTGLLARLSPRERAVIEAVHFAGKSNAQVAEELGVSSSGVRSASVRAMARMRSDVGAASPNPLAHRPDERVSWDARAAARSAAGVFPQTAGSVPVIEAAKRFASEQDRVPSRRELQELTGASGHTAQHVAAALRAQRGELYERTSPVRDRAQAAALTFLAEHGRLPQPSELQGLAQASDHTARAVLRALEPSKERDGDAADGEDETSRRWPSPAADRAESVARGLRAEVGRWPTWREVAERAEVGRSTAADVLRSLRAETPPTAERFADAGDHAVERPAFEHPVLEHPVFEPAAPERLTEMVPGSGMERAAVDHTDEDPTGPHVATARADEAEASAAPLPPDEERAEPVQLAERPAPADPPELIPVPDRAAVSEARDAVARAAVTRAADRARDQQGTAGGGDADSGRAQQLAFWSASDLDTAAAHGTSAGDRPGAGSSSAADASSHMAWAESEDGAD